MSNDLAGAAAEAAALIAASRHVVALVGAGMSAESGIPTFRGKEGIWTKHGEPDLRDYDRFREDPKGWWEQRMKPSPAMNELVAALAEAVPNEGHFALKEMEDRGSLQAIITQNIDNMHQIAGSTKIIEIHGNRTKLRCTICSHRWPLDEFAIDELPPSCPDCGGIVKGDTVMFGEPIPREVLDECIEQTARCDCMLLIGTSAVVYPAAQFPVDVLRSGGALIEINPEDTPLSNISQLVIRAGSGTALPMILEQLKERGDS
ncbi:MAG: NAD-dependent deacylase [Chloroflexi bacterium]|nr:NAD-dependent deacylase [Chloroflexota bacterium]